MRSKLIHPIAAILYLLVAWLLLLGLLALLNGKLALEATGAGLLMFLVTLVLCFPVARRRAREVRKW